MKQGGSQIVVPPNHPCLKRFSPILVLKVTQLLGYLHDLGNLHMLHLLTLHHDLNRPALSLLPAVRPPLQLVGSVNVHDHPNQSAKQGANSLQ